MQQKESNKKNCYWKVCFHYLWNVLHFILGYTRFCFIWTRPLILSFSPFFSPSRSTHSVWKDSHMRWLTGRCDDCECHLHTGEGRRWAPSVKQHSTRIPVPQRAVPGSTWTCCDICPNKHRNTWVKKEHKKHSRGESESESESVCVISHFTVVDFYLLLWLTVLHFDVVQCSNHLPTLWLCAFTNASWRVKKMDQCKASIPSNSFFGTGHCSTYKSHSMLFLFGWFCPKKKPRVQDKKFGRYDRCQSFFRASFFFSYPFINAGLAVKWRAGCHFCLQYQFPFPIYTAGITVAAVLPCCVHLKVQRHSRQTYYSHV